MGRKIIRIRIPKPAKEIIESADTGSIPKLETAEDSIKGIDLQLSSPVGDGTDFKINGKQIRPLHTGRSPWFGAKNGVFVTEQFICIGQIEIPKARNDIPCRFREYMGIRIIFTKIFNNKVLIGGMAAGINR